MRGRSRRTRCALSIVAACCLCALAPAAGALTPVEEAAAPTVNGKDPTHLLQRFTTWLRENGAHFDKVAPVWSEGGGFTLSLVEDCEPVSCVLLRVGCACVCARACTTSAWTGSVAACLVSFTRHAGMAV